MPTVAQLHSQRTRATHQRLAGVGDAQDAVEKLQTELKQAMSEVLKKHDLKLRDMHVTLSIGAGGSTYPGESRSPSGWLTASLDVAK